MPSTATIPVFLKMEAVFEIQAVDEWYGPIDFVPNLGMDGDASELTKRIDSVTVDFFSRSDHSADSLLNSETLYADSLAWEVRQDPRSFLQRELENSSYPYAGSAAIDLTDIDSVRIEKGILMLGATMFSDWDAGNAEPASDPEIRWFICGERVPQIHESFFVPPVDIVNTDWLKLIWDSRFIRDHTRSPLASSITLAYALTNTDEFISWLVHLPIERIRQLPVLPSTMEWITRQKLLRGLL